jgi:hypothetical protein
VKKATDKDKPLDKPKRKDPRRVLKANKAEYIPTDVSNIKGRKPVQKAIANPQTEDPLKNVDTIFENMGGLSRIEREGEILQIDWAIRFPSLTPLEYLTAEKGYSVSQATTVLHESGGADDWEVKRAEIQNRITETVVKRHVDQIAEFNDMYIKGAKVGLAKALEMLTKLSIDQVRDADGNVMIDPKTKRPVYKGFRSIDLLNIMNSLKLSQDIHRRSMGINDGEGGMAQVLEQVTQMNEMKAREMNITNNTINLMMTPGRAEAEQKIETFVKTMSYEDIRAFVDYHKSKPQAIEAEVVEQNKEPSSNV